LKKNILQAVRQLFGEEGAKSTIDILKFTPATRRFILRCLSEDYVRLRAALTVASKYEGQTCVYTVHRASPNLLSFIADSR
ncbi:Ribonuclease P protein subunit p14, partial [Harpegnathos saltator]